MMWNKKDDWDMIDVLGLEVLPARTVRDILVIAEERLVIAPATMSRQVTADRVSRWWALQPRSSAL